MRHFFILGNPRSGTTLFRLLLNAHSEITVPPECGFALWLASKYECADFTSYDVRIEFVKDVLASRKMHSWGVSEAEILVTIESFNPKNYVDAVICIYAAFAKKNDKKVRKYGDKNNYYINEIVSIKRFFPDSKIIFMIRDGRDVASSYRIINQQEIESNYRPILPDSIEEMSSEWSRSAKVVRDNLDERAIIVKYEDLLLNPELELTKICQFIGVDYENSMLNFYLKNDEPVEFLQWKRMTAKPIDESRIGNYLNVLNDQEIRLFNEMSFEMMRHFGYI